MCSLEEAQRSLSNRLRESPWIVNTGHKCLVVSSESPSAIPPMRKTRHIRTWYGYPVFIKKNFGQGELWDA